MELPLHLRPIEPLGEVIATEGEGQLPPDLQVMDVGHEAQVAGSEEAECARTPPQDPEGRHGTEHCARSGTGEQDAQHPLAADDYLHRSVAGHPVERGDGLVHLTGGSGAQHVTTPDRRCNRRGVGTVGLLPPPGTGPKSVLTRDNPMGDANTDGAAPTNLSGQLPKSPGASSCRLPAA